MDIFPLFSTPRTAAVFRLFAPRAGDQENQRPVPQSWIVNVTRVYGTVELAISPVKLTVRNVNKSYE